MPVNTIDQQAIDYIHDNSCFEMMIGLTLSLIVVVATQASSHLLIAQHEALLQLYDAIGCKNDLRCPRFAVDEPCPDGPFLTCEFGFVTHINLCCSSEWSGTLPTTIGLMSSLTFLELQNNRIGGSIPSEIGDIVKLGKLNLMQNRLSGTIPTEVSRLTAMVGLNLADNRLGGTLDGMLFTRMTSLRYLALFDTLVSGAIPSQLGLLTRLTSLFASGNRFSGQMPSQLGRLANLFEIALQSNLLSGTLSSEIADISALTALFLQSNAIAGTVPRVWSKLSRLEWLWLHNNSLTGRVPPLSPKLLSCILEQDGPSETNCFLECPSNCCPALAQCHGRLEVRDWSAATRDYEAMAIAIVVLSTVLLVCAQCVWWFARCVRRLEFARHRLP